MTATAATQLTPAQINVLSLMAYIDTEQEQHLTSAMRHPVRACAC